jgi:hypothetical protein
VNRTGTWSGIAALRLAYSPFWKALTVLEGAEADPSDCHAEHSRLPGQDHQADSAEQRHDQSPAVPAAAQVPDAPGVRGAVGQRARDRGRQHRGDGPAADTTPSAAILCRGLMSWSWIGSST